MNTLSFLGLFTVIAIIFIVIFDSFISNARRLKNKAKYCWPVTHRLDKDGYLQYSVNDELWTYVTKYVETENGPFLSYMKYKNELDSDYINICNVLLTMQACHTWNENELRKYKNNLEKYLSNKKDNK